MSSNWPQRECCQPAFSATQSTQRQYPYDFMWLCLSNTETEVRGGGGSTFPSLLNVGLSKHNFS